MPVSQLTGNGGFRVGYRMASLLSKGCRAMLDRIKKHLIPEARDWWRMWSTWLVGAALAIEAATAWFDAGQLLWVLNLAPRQLNDALPEALLLAIKITLLTLAIIAKLFRQKGLEIRRARREADSVG